MCKYCDNKCSIVNNNSVLHYGSEGIPEYYKDTNKEVFVKNIFKFPDGTYRIMVDDHEGSIIINYCPICGRNLKEE